MKSEREIRKQLKDLKQRYKEIDSEILKIECELAIQIVEWILGERE